MENNKPAHYTVSGRLHTDLLEDMYGPISVQVLSDDNHTREVLLTDQQHIARSYALTIRNDEWAMHQEMQAVNSQIQAAEPDLIRWLRNNVRTSL